MKIASKWPGRPVKSSASDRHAFVRAPCPDAGGARLVDLLNANVRVLAVGRREGSAHYFPLAGLVGETIANAKIHRQHTQFRRRRPLALLSERSFATRSRDQPYFCLSRRTSARALKPDL